MADPDAPATVVYGHRIVPAAAPRPAWGPDRGNVLACAALRQWIDRVGRGRFASPEEIARWVSADDPWAAQPFGKFVLTFDDGYRDNGEWLPELLEGCGAGALVFIASGFITGEVGAFEYDLAHTVARAQTVPAEQKAAVYERWRTGLKPRSAWRRARGVRVAAARLGAPPPGTNTRLYMSADELAALARHRCVVLGTHAHTHPVMTRLVPIRAAREAMLSRHIVEDITGSRVHAFSYPYGAHGPLTRALVRGAGFSVAFATETTPHWRRFAIPRVPLPAHVAKVVHG
jgi:peptidoglycan/xylan/chitin deacetylase (PgdA/CDA1 family)